MAIQQLPANAVRRVTADRVEGTVHVHDSHGKPMAVNFTTTIRPSTPSEMDRHVRTWAPSIEQDLLAIRARSQASPA
jgi:hypothetical protein